MSPQNTVKDWARLIYYLSQNALSLIGVVLTTSSAITLVGFWIYDFMIPRTPHPYVGILLFLILPAVSALQIARGFRMTVAVAAGFAVFSVFVGIFGSFVLNLPTGGAIVIINIFLFMLSFAFKKTVLGSKFDVQR